MPLIGIAAFLIYIFIFQVDIGAIFEELKSVNLYVYLIAVIISLLEVFLFSLSWRALINFLDVKLSVIKSYLLVWSGIFVDTLVPAESISGEAMRIYLIAKEKGNNTCGRVVASLVTHRMLGMMMNVIILIAGMSLLYTEGHIDPLVRNIVSFLTASISFGAVLILVISFREKWSSKLLTYIINIIKNFTPKRWKDKVSHLGDLAISMARSFHDSMVIFRKNPKALIISFGYLILTWISALSIPYLVFLSLNYPISWSIILVTAGIVMSVRATPIGIPFEVGLPEITMTALYTALGVPPALSATATILIRLITLWLRFFFSFIGQQLLNLKPLLANKEKSVLDSPIIK